ncbi:MAG TPA: preprotein translocase subunit YajC [Acidimicrobiales bacterium]|nr:preprotein translocase subunit YajC [Acidimicrobiales bacterium]
MQLISSVSVLVAASTTQTTAAKSTSSTSSSAFLFLIVIVAVAYFVLIRPSRNRRMAAMRASRSVDLGDEVIAGGMVGHVVRLGEGDVDIEVADGVVITFVSGAVQSRTAYEARLAPRGGARGFGGLGGLGARTAPTTTDVQTSHESDAWASDGADVDAHEAGDGDAGASGDADWAHEDGGAEPTGGDK